MQTFMPYKDFAETAKCLDVRRLGKQRVEAMQILMVLTGLTKGWEHHPAVKMWKGYEVVLAYYAYAICDEWTSRGYKDTCREKIKQIMIEHWSDSFIKIPPWLGNEQFHKSHQSNLLRKKPEHYGAFFKCPDNLSYVWPNA